MKKHLIDRLNEGLFGSNKNLSEKELEIVERVRAAFSIWLEQPMMSDFSIKEYLINTFKISQAQAYRDITNVKICLGNVKSAGKEWQRYRANSILEEAYEAAVADDHNKAKSLALIANAMVKVNRLDINEGEQIPWEEVIPQNFDPSSDPTTIGLKPIPDLREKIIALKKKYIEDITIEEEVIDVG